MPRACIYRKSGSAVGAIVTHIDDILGCGEGDLHGNVQDFSEKRYGESEVHVGSFVHVGMELAHEQDFSVTLTQADLTKNVELLPTSPELWAGRKNALSMEYIKLHQNKLGELRWAATVSRPDICARLARIASRINAPRGSDVYRINELVRAVKNWRPATVLEYASSFRPWQALGRNDRLRGALQNRGGDVHGRTARCCLWGPVDGR